MTICAETIPYVADGVIELEEMDLLFTANISFEDQWGDEINKEKLLDLYEDQLHRLVDYYSDRTDLYPVGPLLTSVPDYLGIPNYNELNKKEIKRFCGAGHEMMIILNGLLYELMKAKFISLIKPSVAGIIKPTIENDIYGTTDLRE